MRSGRTTGPRRGRRREEEPVEPQYNRTQRVREHQQSDVGGVAAEQRPEEQGRDRVDDHEREDEKAEDVHTQTPSPWSPATTIGRAAMPVGGRYTIFIPTTGIRLATPVSAPASAGYGTAPGDGTNALYAWKTTIAMNDVTTTFSRFPRRIVSRYERTIASSSNWSNQARIRLPSTSR